MLTGDVIGPRTLRTRGGAFFCCAARPDAFLLIFAGRCCPSPIEKLFRCERSVAAGGSTGATLPTFGAKELPFTSPPTMELLREELSTAILGLRAPPKEFGPEAFWAANA